MDDPPGRIGWRRMPVFIASTFRDMDGERDILTRLVIPAVNEALRRDGRGVSVYPVDLRWGVETDDRLDEATRQRMILETCASEVRRCRPLFIGLLGDQYGWVPPEHLASAALRAAGLVHPGFPVSVTAVEMLCAAHAPDGIPPILLARRTTSGGDEQSIDPRDGQLLTRLEEHLAGMGHTCRPYQAHWDEEDGRFTSTDLADLATAALLGTLDALLTGDDEPVGWLDAELEVQRWTAEREARHFTGRTDELGFIDAYWDYSSVDRLDESGDEVRNPLWKLRHRIGNPVLAVLGDPGSGKSALLAKFAVDATLRGGWPSEVDNPARAYVHVGATAASRRLPVCLLLLLAQLDPVAAKGIADRHGPDALELDHVLDVWLATLAEGMRLYGPLIVVDGLDRLSGALTESRPLAWLPITLGDRARVLVSAVDDSFEARLLDAHPSVRTFVLGELGIPDAVALVTARVQAHHRTMPPGVAELLVAKSGNPRWLVVATELLLTLMAHDYLALRQRPDIDPETALRALLRIIARELPRDLAGIHEEAFHRLLELFDQRFVPVLGLLGVSVAGLGEHDLQEVLGSLGTTLAAVELAVFRAAFSVHVESSDETWQFVHDSAIEGVGRLLDSASEAIGQDARIGFRRHLVRYLVTKPVDHPTRSRELLTLLLFADEPRLVTRALARSELATAESVRFFSALLGELVRDGTAPQVVDSLLDSAVEDEERLTLVDVLVGGVLRFSAREESRRLAARCRALLADTRPGTLSRFGSSTDVLLRLLDIVTRDLPATVAAMSPLTDWLAGAHERGAASLRDMPAPVRGEPAVLAFETHVRVLIEYALAAGMGAFSLHTGDPDVARARLDEWAHVARAFDEPESPARTYRHLLLALAERAWHRLHPDGRFHPDEADFSRIQALTDRTRGSADVVSVLGLGARVHALERLALIGDAEEISAADARRLHEALGFLEEAMWQLAAQLTITPDAYQVEATAIQCGALHSNLLSGCEQHASACRSGIATCLMPLAVDVLGSAAFLELATSSLCSWVESYTDVDPAPLVERLSDEVDHHGTADADPAAEDLDSVDAALILSSLVLAERRKVFQPAVRVLRRGLDSGRPLFLDADTHAEIRGCVTDVEDELLDAVDLDEQRQPERLVNALRGVFEIRTALIAHGLGEPEDVLGAAFCAAFAATLSDEPQHRPEAVRLLGSLHAPLTDPRHRRLLSATRELLGS